MVYRTPSTAFLASKSHVFVLAAVTLVSLIGAVSENGHCADIASCRDGVSIDGRSDSSQDVGVQLLQHKSAERRGRGVPQVAQTAAAPSDEALQGFPAMSTWYNFKETRPPASAESRLWMLHTPKAAGDSLYNDFSIAYGLWKNLSILSAETCLPTMMSQMQNDDVQVVMLREPVSHIYSLYMECRYDDEMWDLVPKSERGFYESVSTWLRHFTGAEALASPQDTSDLHCYHPLDLQTRSLSCTGANNNVYENATFDVALANLKKPDVVVGLTEYYQESACLIQLHGTGELHPHCNCEDKDAWSSFRSLRLDHSVPAHNKSDLSAEDVMAIENLTVLDRQLYEAAKQRFHAQIKEAESQTNIRILCKDIP
eukprot:TRINITY_DN47835_c0_g1_i1.p1 TRINITY_DN47835_c0_g1~~TRINITY_DN47835_c0_g1_i1.p1  ORF type:complete len:370 (+),score=58.39 TRINITY_DN47835_c0_g1_i1:93-1202(+)